MKRTDDIPVKVNFMCRLRDRKGNVVSGSTRVVHNVFTDVGRDWMAHLIAIQTVNTPDVPYTQRRVRWMSVGTGVTQAELATVLSLESPVPTDELGNYLSVLDETTFPPIDGIVITAPTPRFIRTYGFEEITTAANPTVPVSEAGLFVDVYQVSSIGGFDDHAFGTLDMTLNPKASDNAPVSYSRFEPVTKTLDFALEVQWDYRFGV